MESHFQIHISKTPKFPTCNFCMTSVSMLVQLASETFTNDPGWKVSPQNQPEKQKEAGQVRQYEDNLSSSLQACISAVERLSKKSENLFKNCSKYWIGPTLHLYGTVAQLLGWSVPLLKRDGTHHKAPCDVTCVAMEGT